MQKSCSYYRGIFYCPVATTGEYLRKNHQFRVWELRKSNFLYFPFDRASWDKYMFNGNISMKFYDMSQFVRSKGKKTVQRAHCALVSRDIFEKLQVKSSWEETFLRQFRKILMRRNFWESERTFSCLNTTWWGWWRQGRGRWEENKGGKDGS